MHSKAKPNPYFIGNRARKTFLSLSLFFLLSLSFNFLSFASPQDYEFTITAPAASSQDIWAADGNAYLLYYFDKFNFTSDVGKPKLPFTTAKVYLPSNAIDVKLSIIESSGHDEHLDYPIYPAANKIVKRSTAGFAFVDEKFSMDNDFYSRHKSFYPRLKAQIKEINNLRGVRYAVVTVYPYQYNPVSKQLHIDDKIKLRLTWKTAPKKDSEITKSLGRNFEKIIKDMNLLNLPEQKPQQKNDIYTLSPKNWGIVNRPKNLLTGTKTDYLIITADDFFNNTNIDAFAGYRASPEGGNYNVSIVKIPDIYAANFPDKTGSESNDQLIKMFIKYAYDHWNADNSPLEFVLLVGDAITDADSHQIDASNLVPTHVSSYQSYEEPIATDYWYSCVDGSNPSEYLSDSFDAVADIAIGRLPVKTEEELANIVNKTIAYETIFPNSPGEWRFQSGLISGFALNQSIYLDQTRSSYQTLRDNYLLPNHEEVIEDDRDYKNDYSDDDAGSLAFKETIKSYFNQGRFMIIQSSHGSLTAWWDGAHNQDIFDTSNVGLLTNTDRLPIVFSASCYAGIFDSSEYEGLGEAFTENSNTGAIAFLGSSRLTDLGSLSLAEQLFSEIYNNGSLILGFAMLTAKNNLYFRNYTLLFNLQGDPALNISQVIQQSPKPDLSCSINSYEISADTVTFHAKIKNSGLGDASNVALDLYDGNPEIGGTRIDVNINPVFYLSAGEELSYDFVVPVWNKDYEGYLYLKVDSSNQIAEFLEDNNVSPPFYLSLVEQTYTENYIGNGNWPSFDGRRIVWCDNRSGNDDIYMYDLGEDKVFGTSDDSGEVRITTDPLSQIRPAIYGSKIIWQDYINDRYNSDIYMYDLGPDGVFGTSDDSGEIRITTNSSSQYWLGIDGNKILWEDNRAGMYGGDIYMYDLGPDGVFATPDDSGEIPVSTNSASQDFPAIDGNKIIWADHRNGHYDIYMYDLGADGVFGTADDLTDFPITSNSLQQLSPPAINGNKIVWADYRNGGYNIYLYDLGPDGQFGTADDSGETFITNLFSLQMRPVDVYENKIVWVDLRNGSWDIHLYDLGADGKFGTGDLGEGEIRLTSGGAEITERNSPIIYGNKVVYEGSNEGFTKIYLVDFNRPPVFDPIEDQNVFAGDTLTFQISALDPNNDELSYSASNLPAGATFNSATRTFTWVPSNMGAYSATFIATDTSNASDSKIVNIFVSSYDEHRPPKKELPPYDVEEP